MYRLHGFFTQNTMKTLYVLEALDSTARARARVQPHMQAVLS